MMSMNLMWMLTELLNTNACDITVEALCFFLRKQKKSLCLLPIGG